LHAAVSRPISAGHLSPPHAHARTSLPILGCSDARRMFSPAISDRLSSDTFGGASPAFGAVRGDNGAALCRPTLIAMAWPKFTIIQTPARELPAVARHSAPHVSLRSTPLASHAIHQPKPPARPRGPFPFLSPRQPPSPPPKPPPDPQSPSQGYLDVPAPPSRREPLWCEQEHPGPIDLRRQIFCNRSLNMKQIKAR
jgi:hypothetical protein